MKTYKEYALIESTIKEIDEAILEAQIDEVLGFAITDKTKQKIMNNIEKSLKDLDSGLMFIYDAKKVVLNFLKKSKDMDSKKVLGNVAEELKGLIKNGSADQLTKDSLLMSIESIIAKS